MITYLGIAVAVAFLAFALYGFGIVVRRPPTVDELQLEHCSLCRLRFPREQLIERQVGDARLFYFCATCVDSLAHEASLKILKVRQSSSQSNVHL